MGFTECVDGTTRELLAKLIQISCLSIGLDYVGGKEMIMWEYGSSLQWSCKDHIQLKYPKAVHFHCTSHKLNLLHIHVSHQVLIANMSVINSIAKFFSYSLKHQTILTSHV